MVPLVPKLAVTTPGARVAGADGAHHVVAAAGADQDAGVQAQILGGGRLAERPPAASLPINGGSAPARPASMALERCLRPLAFADIEQGRAAGVAAFHDLVASQPEIQIIVRQQDGGEAGEILRLRAV